MKRLLFALMEFIFLKFPQGGKLKWQQPKKYISRMSHTKIANFLLGKVKELEILIIIYIN